MKSLSQGDIQVSLFGGGTRLCSGNDGALCLKLVLSYSKNRLRAKNKD